MSDKINKLQLRAKVFDIINSYKSEDDFGTSLNLQNRKILNEIADKEFLVDMLLRELINAVDFKQDVIKFIICDNFTLNIVEMPLWNILKDKTVPDSKKEILLRLLRLLDGKVDVALLMDCMQNFDAVIDEQTLGLLQQAIVNPEAQIDFLDFLFSLSADEQIQLIESLTNDFHNDELANILYPCLRVNLTNNVKNYVIKALGTSQSALAVKPLKTFLKIAGAEDLKKEALKALNQLSTDGIDIDNSDIINLREKEVCKTAKFYKAFLSQIDGCGNQGLIFSRITPDGKIIAFSTVINVLAGIMDCFGLYMISAADFQKVISRFKANDFVVPITAEIAKGIFEYAEKINSSSGDYLPYEYICWSVFACDIEPEQIPFENLMTEKITDYSNKIYDKLYDLELFDTWFFEYDDNIYVQELINMVITNYKTNINELFEKIELQIEEIFPKVFVAEKINDYSLMLKNAAYICYLNHDLKHSNILMNLSEDIFRGEEKLLKDIIRRSVLQYLATLVTKEEKNVTENRFTRKNKLELALSNTEAYDLLTDLETKWDE